MGGRDSTVTTERELCTALPSDPFLDDQHGVRESTDETLQQTESSVLHSSLWVQHRYAFLLPSQLSLDVSYFPLRMYFNYVELMVPMALNCV